MHILRIVYPVVEWDALSAFFPLIAFTTAEYPKRYTAITTRTPQTPPKARYISIYELACVGSPILTRKMARKHNGMVEAIRRIFLEPALL